MANCENHEYLKQKIEQVCGKVNELDKRTHNLEVNDAKSNEQLTTLFNVMNEIKLTIGEIKTHIETLSKKEDPFKKAMYEIGIYAIKFSVGAGLIAYVIIKVG